MALREQLTTDYIKNLGFNNFEITNLAIELMKSYIHAGNYISVEDALEIMRKKGPYEIIAELHREKSIA